MRPVWFAVLPVAAAALEIAVVSALGARPEVWWAFQLACLAFTGACCLTAARAFGRGALLWKGWVLLGTAFLLPLAYRFGVGPERTWWLTRVPGFVALDVAYAIAVNASAAVAALLFVRAFFDAGLGFGVPRRRRVVSAASSVVVAVAIGVPVLFVEVGDALAQGATSDALFAAISAIGDIVCFTLVGALAGIARELRGGALSWIWSLLAVGNLGYLAYDAAFAVATRAPGGADRYAVPLAAVYTAGCIATAAAALAHRSAVRAAVAAAPARE